MRAGMEAAEGWWRRRRRPAGLGTGGRPARASARAWSDAGSSVVEDVVSEPVAPCATRPSSCSLAAPRRSWGPVALKTWIATADRVRPGRVRARPMNGSARTATHAHRLAAKSGIAETPMAPALRDMALGPRYRRVPADQLGPSGHGNLMGLGAWGLGLGGARFYPRPRAPGPIHSPMALSTTRFVRCPSHSP